MARRSRESRGRLEPVGGRQAARRQWRCARACGRASTSTSVQHLAERVHADRPASGRAGRHDRERRRDAAPRLEEREPAVGRDDVQVVSREDPQPADRVPCDDRNELARGAAVGDDAAEEPPSPMSISRPAAASPAESGRSRARSMTTGTPCLAKSADVDGGRERRVGRR